MKKLYNLIINISFVKLLMKNKVIAKLLSYEVILYVFFGVVTTIVNVGLFWFLGIIIGEEPVIDHHILGFNFTVPWGTMMNNFISWVITILVAFVTNKIYVFESRSWQRRLVAREFAGFVSARIFSLIVEQFGLFLLHALIGIDKMISKALLAVIVVVMNYFFSKFIIFAKKKKKD